MGKRVALPAVPTKADRALAAQQSMRAIVRDWPALEARLPAQGVPARSEKIKKSSGFPAPIDMRTHEVIREVDAWVAGLVRELVAETSWRPPRSLSTPVVLAAIAGQRIGHFTAARSELQAAVFAIEAARLREKVKRTAYPSGAHWMKLGVPCMEMVESDDTAEEDDPSDRLAPCPGEYQVLVREHAKHEPPLECTADHAHTVQPLEWRQANMRAKLRGTNAEDELRAGRGLK